MTATLRRAGTLVGLVLVGAFGVGCSDDPSGPGTLTLTVEGPQPLGAAVIELRGDGIEGAEPLAAGWTHLEQVAGGQGQTAVHRLVLVQQASGGLSATLRVDDVGRAPPSATLLLASDGSDLPLSSLDGIAVRVRR